MAIKKAKDSLKKSKSEAMTTTTTTKTTKTTTPKVVIKKSPRIQTAEGWKRSQLKMKKQAKIASKS